MKSEEFDMMKCKELFALLSEFIDGRLPEGICLEIQAHMADCAPCVAFLNTLQKTVAVCQQLPHQPLPDEMKCELKEILQTAWNDWKPHPSS
jgi:anti-sigma factor RsiW